MPTPAWRINIKCVTIASPTNPLMLTKATESRSTQHKPHQPSRPGNEKTGRSVDPPVFGIKRSSAGHSFELL
ncbi:MAG: hypothetical protein RLZ97_2456 [Verrucomicrobiota bacterium]